MSIKQLPLPGLEEFTIADKLPPMMLVNISHKVLRDDMRELFDSEIKVLRLMGTLNGAQCPDSWYLAQRKICSAIKELVLLLDDMNEAQEDSSHGE